MHKPDLALNNLQCLRCHKGKPHQPHRFPVPREAHQHRKDEDR